MRPLKPIKAAVREAATHGADASTALIASWICFVKGLSVQRHGRLYAGMCEAKKRDELVEIKRLR